MLHSYNICNVVNYKKISPQIPSTCIVNKHLVCMYVYYMHMCIPSATYECLISVQRIVEVFSRRLQCELS